MYPSAPDLITVLPAQSCNHSNGSQTQTIQWVDMAHTTPSQVISLPGNFFHSEGTRVSSI